MAFCAPRQRVIIGWLAELHNGLVGKRQTGGFVGSLAVAVLLLASCSTSPHFASRSTTTTAPSSTSKLSPGIPTTYLAVDSDQGPGRLVVVDTATGQVTDQLVPSLAGGGVVWASVDAAGSVIFYGQGLGTCAEEIDAVRLNGSDRHTAVPSPPGDAGGDPALRPDAGLLAFSRTQCNTIPLVSRLVISSTAGSVTASTHENQPASPQAWSQDGRMLLGLDTSSAALHLLTVTAAGTVTDDRILPPPAGCHFNTALFSPAGPTVISQMWCGTATSLVRVDPSTGGVVSTLVSPQAGSTLLLGSIDASGRFLTYGVATASLTSTAWYVLAGEHSTPLKVPPDSTPAAW